jgi:hypothetical protein
MIYFSDAPVRLDSVDEAQYQSLKDFKQQIRSRALFEVYDTPSNFEHKFRRQLSSKINDDAYFRTRAEPENGGQSGAAESIEQVLNEAAQTIPAMSKKAKTLLVEASLDRGGHILHARYIGGVAIQTNGKQLIEGDDPRSRQGCPGKVTHR